MAKNGITMVGDIDRCLLFVYRAPVAQLEPFLPKPLTLFAKGGFGFVNVVVSDLSHIRPKGLPAWIGTSYRHAAYRLHCRFQPAGSDPIDGLFFLRSDADSHFMVAAGNLLTDFQFHFADIRMSEKEICITGKSGNGNVDLDLAKPPVLTPGSPFETLEEAERELKYKPAAFFVHPNRVDVLRITREEASWRSKLIAVARSEFDFLKPFDATLEVCYRVEPIHYVWNRAERYPI